jgi:hypothetical protein
LTSQHPLESFESILCIWQLGAKIVDLPLSGKQAVAQVQRMTRTVRHRSSKNLRVHSRNLESILLPPRVEWVDGVLHVTVPGAVLAHQWLPNCVYHYLSTSCMRGGTSALADHLLPIENLHDAGEHHAPWPGDTLDPALWGPGDAQLEQQTMK